MSNDTGKNIPEHIGFIMDGNRRWTKANNLSRFEGHRKGFSVLKEIAKEAHKRGVKFVSFYAFSTENWNRTKEEVSFLMNFTFKVLTEELDDLDKNNIRFRFLGSENNINNKLIKAIRDAETKTKNNSGGTLALCFNYGGHQEIIDATKSIIRKGINPDELTPELFFSHLYGPDIPPVDLVIRTSGEHRISNFMLWRVAYSELIFSDKYWPDYSNEDLDEALTEYNSRERRLGA